jgi:hypothetical protein
VHFHIMISFFLERGMVLHPKTGLVATSEFNYFNDNLRKRVPFDNPVEGFDARHYARFTLEWRFEKVETILRQAAMGVHSAATSASNPEG